MVNYNLDFEIEGLVMLIIIYIFVKAKYTFVSKSIKAFRTMIVCMIIAQSLDVVTGYTISHSHEIAYDINTVINTVYLLWSVVFLYTFSAYVNSYFETRNKRSRMNSVSRYVALFYLGLLVLNIPSAILFKFTEEGEYIKGPCYVLEFLIPVFYIVYSLITVLYHRRSFTRFQIHSVIFFALLAATMSALQFFKYNDVLLSFCGADFGVLIATFSLETPDYRKMTAAMDKLKESQEATQRAVEKAEKASSAKSEFLARMSHEIRTPINAMLGFSDLISQHTKEEKTALYSKKTLDAGHELLALIDDILLYTDPDAHAADAKKGTRSYMEEDTDNKKIMINAPKAKILVVDDNKINLDLFKGLMEPTGIKLEFAENGAEALQLIRNNHYNLVFMDHMMPVMDGVTAFEFMVKENLVPDTPVIVVTANATYGARDTYLKIGFDDYISKPVSQQQLFRAISEYLPDRLIEVSDWTKEIETEVVYTREELLKYFDFLQVETGLKYCADNIEFYVEILESYIEHSRYESLNNHFNENNWDDYRIGIHALKNASFSIGSPDLSEMAKELEIASRDRDTETLRAKHKPFMDAYKEELEKISEGLVKIKY